LSIIPGCTVRDIFEKTYPEGLPPSLTLHIAHGLVHAQQYLKTQAVSRCHRDLKNGRNTMLSYQPNVLPLVTLIDLNGIHPWREYKAVEHTVFMVWRFMGKGRTALEEMETKGYSEKTLEEAKLFYETMQAYQVRPNSTFAELVGVMERFPPTLANDLRDEDQERILNDILQRPRITKEALDKAIAEGGMEVRVV
jgi:hypothetical protein